jgi:hypothetical protein
MVCCEECNEDINISCNRIRLIIDALIVGMITKQHVNGTDQIFTT